MSSFAPCFWSRKFSLLNICLIQNNGYKLWNLFVQHLGKNLHLLSTAAHITGLKEAMLCEISGSFIIELNNLIAHDIHGGLNNLTQLTIYH